MYRRTQGDVEVFLVHPGGPFWASKDLGAWSVPKGEYLDTEQPLAAAKREFHEETGFDVPDDCVELGVIKQAGGKIVSAWAFEGDGNPAELTSDRCQMEWPPHSGRAIDFPEVDRGAWFPIEAARERILKSQQPFLDALLLKLH